MKKPPLKCQAIMRKHDSVNISDDDDYSPTVKRPCLELKSVTDDGYKHNKYNTAHVDMFNKYMNEGNDCSYAFL